MVPAEVWRYLVAKVRLGYPKTMFLLEGLGGAWVDNARILQASSMGCAYSELFQKHTTNDIREHLRWCAEVNESLACPVHFAETHDNPRLASHGADFARMRTALAALASHSGAWGISCGLEWLADKKIDVCNKTSIRWGAQNNQVAWIGRLNQLLQTHPCFAHGAQVAVVDVGSKEVVALSRTALDGASVWVLSATTSLLPTSTTAT